MSELIPYGEFEPGDLAREWHLRVKANRHLLEQRNMLGVVRRYGVDEETARDNIVKGQAEANPAHLVYVDDDGNRLGSASVYDSLALYRDRLPLPAGLARTLPLAAVHYPHANPNIHGWVASRYQAPHHDLYGLLIRRALGDAEDSTISSSVLVDTRPRPWTVEPLRSPSFVHKAIAAAGLGRIARARFDDGENRRTVAQTAVLYARLYSEWPSPRGRLKELRTGHMSLLTRLELSAEEQAAKNPIGR